ncbi:MAG: dihydroneopterin aldolase [Actinobacteria bacterium]|nr:dihydroneopterin aldolase [Actinomycetota bacterium]
MDRIRIRGLRAPTHIGATEEERARPQTVVINIEIATELRRAGASDDLADTIDYGQLAATAADIVRANECRLLEHLAEKIATALSGAPGAQAVDVEVIKESPASGEQIEAASVTIER